MTWLLFLLTASVIVLAGTRLARYGDVLGERSGLGRNWIGVVLLAATTSLPELFTGIGATALYAAPDIAVGDVLGSCMVNLLILSAMDAIQPDVLSARAHQGHALSIAFGSLLIGVAGLAIAAGPALPALGWVGIQSFALVALYFVAMRVIFSHERERLARARLAVVEESRYADISLRSAAWHYAAAAAVVVMAALFLPRLGAVLARETGLGEAFVGSLFVAVTTSLPEIVVSIAAVRLGAIELGIANVLGSNLFNMLILALDDMLYTAGPLLADASPVHGLSVLAVMMMNALFLIGLTYQVARKRFVVAWDTAAIAAVYVVVTVLQYWLR